MPAPLQTQHERSRALACPSTRWVELRGVCAFVLHGMVFGLGIPGLRLVNEATREAGATWWLVIIWALGACSAAMLLTRRLHGFSRITCLTVLCVALATLAHGRVELVSWLAIGVALARCISDLGRRPSFTRAR